MIAQHHTYLTYILETSQSATHHGKVVATSRLPHVLTSPTSPLPVPSFKSPRTRPRTRPLTRPPPHLHKKSTRNYARLAPCKNPEERLKAQRQKQPWANTAATYGGAHSRSHQCLFQRPRTTRALPASPAPSLGPKIAASGSLQRQASRWAQAVGSTRRWDSTALAPRTRHWGRWGCRPPQASSGQGRAGRR